MILIKTSGQKKTPQTIKGTFVLLPANKIILKKFIFLIVQTLCKKFNFLSFFLDFLDGKIKFRNRRKKI